MAVPPLPIRIGTKVKRRAATTVAGYRHALRRRPPDAAMLTAALRPGLALGAAVDAFAAREGAGFFFGPGEASEIVRRLEGVAPGWRRRTLADADRIADGTVRLLGRDEVPLRGSGREAGSLPWHEDVLSGHRWNPRTFYRRIEVPYDRGVDIKVPWELSRCQHLPTLGMAYSASDDERYASEAVVQIEDWIRSNPHGYGVNWACTMDVAIRAVNWLWTHHLIAGAASATPEFLTRLLASLVDHARHIAANIERSDGGVTTNHTLADYTGLLYLGLLLPQMAESPAWADAAMEGVADCMRTQVLPDGADFESSIPYHRLVLEMFLGCHLLAERNGRSFGGDYRDSLERMLEYVLHYTRPDGAAPVIGDNDDGRLQILSSYFGWRSNDHRYLLGLGAGLFGRDDFAAAAAGAPGAAEEAAWMLGPQVLDSRPAAAQELSSRAFEAAGRYVLRHGSHHAVVCADEVGTAGLGNHKHNDIFSFELSVSGTAVVVDPGSFLYTSDLAARDAFRSTRAHNTLVVDATEQNRTTETFGMSKDAAVEIAAWRTTDDLDLLDATHTGYERLPDPVVHRRAILLLKDPFAWVVVDVLRCAGEHGVESHLHLAPGGEATEGEANPAERDAVAAALATAQEELDAVRPLTPRPDRAVRYRRPESSVVVVPVNDWSAIDVESGWVAPRYGRRVAAPVLRLSGRLAGGAASGYVLIEGRA